MLAVLDEALAMEPGEVTDAKRKRMAQAIIRPLQNCMNRKLQFQQMVLDRDAQIAALQAWKDAVPVQAILTMRFGNILDGFTVDDALEEVESWLMDIAEQPEVTPTSS